MPVGAGVLSLLYRRPFILYILEHLAGIGTVLGPWGYHWKRLKSESNFSFPPPLHLTALE